MPISKNCAVKYEYSMNCPARKYIGIPVVEITNRSSNGNLHTLRTAELLECPPTRRRCNRRCNGSLRNPGRRDRTRKSAGGSTSMLCHANRYERADERDLLFQRPSPAIGSAKTLQPEIGAFGSDRNARFSQGNFHIFSCGIIMTNGKSE